MRTAYDVAAVRAAERDLTAGLPDGALMQRAAAGLARRCAALLDRVYGARVVLLVGKGDNGGDALYAGALLAGRGARVDAVLAADTAHPGGLAALRAAGGHVGADPAAIDRADLVVDGILGIGGSGGLREPAAALADRAAAASATVVAVDVPSGVDAGSGRVDGAAVRADVTVTFGALKAGLVVSPGAEHAGQVELVDIGLAMGAPTLSLLDADDVAARLPEPHGESSKYTRGVVGVVAGSDTYTGAAVLATGGAVRAGAGMVRYVGTAHPAEMVRRRWAEVVVTEVAPGDAEAVLDAGRVQAWVVGSGLGTDEHSSAVIEAILRTDLPVLVDADGITVLADHHGWLTRRDAPTLLTPHAGEFARLMGTERESVEADRLAWARRAADELGVTMLLKGTTTVLADPGGSTRVNPTGTAALATAGSGDVLSGGCGALLSAGLSPMDAGSCGAFLHGLAGRLAGGDGSPVAAEDLVTHWHAAVAAVRGLAA